MSINKSNSDDWFDKSPSAVEREQFWSAVLAHLAERGFGSGEAETMISHMPELIERLDDVQPQWKNATARQMTTKWKRFLAHYDQLRNAYKNKDDTEAAIADFKHAKKEAEKTAN